LNATLTGRLLRAACYGLLLACLAPGAHAITVCSVGVGGTGIQQDTGTGGTGIESPGTGGTGVSADVGVGGTGIGRDTGTGGTGLQADVGIGGTGIVGVITGFGSICVNGIEVEYDRATPVLENGSPGQAGDLKVGQVVEVLAAGGGERVFARHIHVQDALRGPVTRVDRATRRLEVMHRPVRWDAGTIAGERGSSPLTLDQVRPGEFLRVSGFQTPAGEIVASRIDAAAPGPVQAVGPVSEVRNRQIRLQDLPVELGQAARLSPRQEVIVTGRWQGDRIMDARVEERPSVPFGGRAERVSLQGALGERLSDGSFRFGSSRLTVGAEAQMQGRGRDQLRTGDIVQVDGRLSRDNSLRAERVLAGERLPRPDRSRREERGERQQPEDDAGGAGESAEKSGSDRDGGSDSGAERREGADEDAGERDRSETDRVEQDGGDRGGEGAREKIERIDGEKPEKPEAIEKIEKVEKVEKVERIERERPEKVEKIEKIERERVEKIEKPERSDRDR